MPGFLSRCLFVRDGLCSLHPIAGTLGGWPTLGEARCQGRPGEPGTTFEHLAVPRGGCPCTERPNPPPFSATAVCGFGSSSGSSGRGWSGLGAEVHLVDAPPRPWAGASTGAGSPALTSVGRGHPRGRLKGAAAGRIELCERSQDRRASSGSFVGVPIRSGWVVLPLFSRGHSAGRPAVGEAQCRSRLGESVTAPGHPPTSAPGWLPAVSLGFRRVLLLLPRSHGRPGGVLLAGGGVQRTTACA